MSDITFNMDQQAVRRLIARADFMQNYIESVATSQQNEGDTVRSFLGANRAKAIIYRHGGGADDN